MATRFLDRGIVRSGLARYCTASSEGATAEAASKTAPTTGHGVEAHAEKVAKKVETLDELLLIRRMKLKKIEVPCKQDKRPLLRQDPPPMIFGIEDGLDKIGDEMTAVIFNEILLMDNMLLLHRHLPPLSQVGKDYALFVMVITSGMNVRSVPILNYSTEHKYGILFGNGTMFYIHSNKGKQDVRAVRVSKVVSASMLNANTQVSVPINLSNQVLSLLGFVGKHPLNVLVGSGCFTNFVSTTLVSKLRLSTQQSMKACQVELADGSYLQCNKKVQQLEVQMKDYQDQLGFSVMPLSHYDMILGQSWLYQYDPIISFRDHSIRLYHDNQEQLRGLFNTQPITMVSAMQVKRLVHKRDCTTALVMLSEAEDDRGTV
ncbi:hypothetical protein L7F22_006448 [Adiantum nelumboides]|nr:hypothetical protein [Adiantum nelumboides]